MTEIMLEFALAAIAIIIAGSLLTRFADRIAESTGLGKVFVGSLFLAGATSLPELMVDIRSVQMGLPDLAVGDLLGSSLFNLLILSVLDFTYPSEFRGTSFSPKYLHHSLSAMLSIVLTSLIGIAIVADLSWSLFGINAILWVIIVFYGFGMRLVFLDGTPAASSKTVVPDTSEANKKNSPKNLILSIIAYLACATMILVSAPFLVHASDQLAHHTGLHHHFIGTTLIAFSTSLPELVTTIAAFRMGVPDLALGNIFGSNAFNMLMFFPMDFLEDGNLLQKTNKTHAITVLAVILSSSIAVMGQLYRKKERKKLTEPSSELVVLVVLTALFILSRA
jgi:cation:H+ antiporter